MIRRQAGRIRSGPEGRGTGTRGEGVEGGGGTLAGVAEVSTQSISIFSPSF